jgi:hypothetical protein
MKLISCALASLFYSSLCLMKLQTYLRILYEKKIEGSSKAKQHKAKDLIHGTINLFIGETNILIQNYIHTLRVLHTLFTNVLKATLYFSISSLSLKTSSSSFPSLRAQSPPHTEDQWPSMLCTSIAEAYVSEDQLRSSFVHLKTHLFIPKQGLIKDLWQR